MRRRRAISRVELYRAFFDEKCSLPAEAQFNGADDNPHGSEGPRTPSSS